MNENNPYYDVASEVFKTADKEVVDEVAKITKPTIEEIKILAKEVLEQAIKIKNDYERIDAKVKFVNDENVYREVTNFKKEMVNSKRLYLNLMEKIFNLQNAVNSFLGQKIQMIYTYIGEDGKVTVYEFDNIIDHLRPKRESDSSAFKGSLDFSKSTLQKLKEKQRKDTEEQKKLDKTFEEVYSRAMISKEKLGLKSSFYIFWKEKRNWKQAYITSMGALGEAYFKFFISAFDGFTKYIENNVGIFITHKNFGVISGDSTSGFLQGDFSVSPFNSNKTIEYGIKAQGASSMGYSDIVRYAKNIYESSDLEEYLLNLKKSLSKKKGNNLAMLKTSKEIDKTIRRKIIDEMLKQGKGKIDLEFEI